MRAAAIVVVVAAVTACTSGDRRPLNEAIVGAWDDWCRTDTEDQASCLGKEDTKLVETFAPDGTVELAVDGRGDPPARGRWTVTGADVELSFAGFAAERYRGRIEHGHLVLWTASGGFGMVFGRHGETFIAPSGPVTTGGTTTRTIGGLRYTIALPAGYRLSRDDHDHQRWELASGPGLVVNLTAEPRPTRIVDGHALAAPCNPDARIGGTTAAIDGFERDASVANYHCADDLDDSLLCTIAHPRGYLEAADKAAAIAVCKSVVLSH